MKNTTRDEIFLTVFSLFIISEGFTLLITSFSLNTQNRLRQSVLEALVTNFTSTD